MEDNKLWFKARLYGWGWKPITWQGWFITLLYIFILVWYFLKVDATSHSVSDTLVGFAPLFIFATFLFLFICYAKGEKPGWHWGNIDHKPHP